MSLISQKNQAKHFLFISIFLMAVFILAIAVWYSPILFKGYSPNAAGININIARNFNETGIFSLENELNVVLPSSLVSEEGEISDLGNKLAVFLYAGVLKVFDSPSLNQLALISVIINALALIIFTILVSNLFNWKTGLLFALVYIFLPFNWRMSYSVGSYEFALIFIALFFFFYLQAEKKGSQKYARIFWILAGIFLAGAVFCKECFILLPIFLVLFLLWKKRKEALIFILIPYILLMGVFWLPNFVQESIYFDLLLGDSLDRKASTDFSFYGHLYPDPYTYHFNKDDFLSKELEEYNQGGFSVDKIEKAKLMKNIGAKGVSILERLKVSLIIGARHVFRFFSLEDIGGPFIFLLLLFGLGYLKKENKYLYQFFVFWILSAIFLMSFVVLVSRNHLVDFGWAIALGVTLGILTIVQVISNHFNLERNKIIWMQILIFGAAIYNFILANHVFLGRSYDNLSVLQMEAYGQLIEPLNINDKDVIALNVHGSCLYHLNYLTDKSMIIFRTKTLESLVEENKLESAFEKFKVKYIIGYPDDLSKEIVKQASVVNLGSSPIEPVEPSLSRNKGWLMNLVK
jgi:hypothetical protein